MHSFLHDLRYGARALFRQPLFTVVAVVVLGLGIGANTAVFSVIDAVLLRPLPYPDADRLMLIRESTNLFENGSVSLPNYDDWRAAQQTFTDLAITNNGADSFSVPQDGGRQSPERVRSVEASANFLGLLGQRPVLGRDFTPAEDAPGGPHAMVLSDAFWRRRFGADPGVLGRRVLLDAVGYEIIGVLPPTFGYGHYADVVIPLGDLRKEVWVNDRGNHPGFSVLGRRRPGITPAAARDDLNAIAGELARRYPDTNTDRRVSVRGLQDAAVQDYRRALYLLLGAVGCVLLIACANVANLQLARAAGRTKELTVRAALGASRWRLVRQTLTESALLGLLGGVAGVLLAMWAIDAMISLAPAGLNRFREARLDWTALGFAAGAALGTGLLVGVWPAWRRSHPAAMASALHESAARGASGGSGQVRARSVLVVAQVALALVLLAGAGLALQSFWKVRNAPPGFRPDGILTLSISLPAATYPKEKITPFYDALLERVRALPGVACAATGVNTPFDDNEWDSSVHLTGTPPDKPGEEPSAEINYVSPDYFKVMGMPILRGRGFDGREAAGQPKSVIVDESFVQKFFPGQDPIGRHIDDNQTREKDPPPVTIVGVVARTRNDAPAESVYLDKMVQVHFCAAQHPPADCRLLVRVDGGDPLRLVEPIRRAVLALDPQLAIADANTMEQNIAASLSSQRLTMVLLGTFAALALGLATVGLYGVMALSVTQRTRELGIRLALGAQRRAVLALVMRQGAALVAVGLGVGLLAALGAGRLLASVLYGVAGSDPLILGSVCAVLAGAALLACWLPARRATRVDPMIALRNG